MTTFKSFLLSTVTAFLLSTGILHPCYSQSCAASSDCANFNVCTIDTCIAGECEFVSIDCDDSDACTLDDCDTLTGCFHTALPADFSYYITCYQNETFVVDFTDLSDCAYEWHWNFGNGDTSIEQNPSVAYLSPGIYSVTLTINSSGVPATTTQQINLEAINVPAISGPTEACSSDSQAYAITNYSSSNDYLWIVFGGTISNPAADSLEYITWSNGFGGTITVFAENDLGCFTEGSLEVADCPCDISISSLVTGINCLNPTGCINLTISGGSQTYTYSWSKDPGPFSSTSEDICNLTIGNYSVAVTDEFGCSVEYGPIEIADESLTLSHMKTDAICGNANGSIDLAVSPEGFYSYSWSTGWVMQDISGLAAGTYTVTITDSVPCSYTRTVTISNISTLQGGIESMDATCGNCDGSVTAAVTSNYPPIGYHWTGNLVTTTPTLSNLCPGDYSVTATDMMGCSVTMSVEVAEDCGCDTVDMELTIDDTLYCLDDTIHYTISSNTRPVIGFFFDELTNVYPILPSLNTPVHGSLAIAEGIADYILTPGEHQFCFVQLNLDGDCEPGGDCVQFRIDSCYNPCNAFNLHANFSWGKNLSANAQPNTYIFTSASTIAPDLEFTFIEWDFGDGSTLTVAPPQSLTAPVSHTFANSPPYEVCLSVAYIDPVTYYCCKEEYCVQIQPGACDTVSLVAVVNSTPDANDPDIIHFNAVAPSFPVQQYLWNFGDGTGGSGEFVTHAYDEEGYYDVCVTVIYHFPGNADICCPVSDCDEVCIGNPQPIQYQMKCINEQPGASDGKDAVILSSSFDPDMAKTNFSDYECVMAHSTSAGVVFRSLLDFDLSSVEPNSLLETAKLTLYNSMCSQHDHSGSGTVLLRRVTTPWDKATVTWDNQPATTATNQITLSSSQLNSQESTEIDVSLLVRDMLKDRERSYGFMLMLGDEKNYSGVSFASSDNTDAGMRPMLDVCWQKQVSTGISSLIAASSIKIYPNPSEGSFNIDLTSVAGNKRLLQVLDINGKTVLERKDCNDTEVLDLSKVENGIYIIKVMAEDKSYVVKAVKM